MSDRHFPRLCGICQAPMARHDGACWRCGAQWASEEAPGTTLRVIAGGRLLPAGPSSAEPDVGIGCEAVAVAVTAVAVRA